MSLAQAGGYGFAYVAEPSTRDGADPGSRPLSLSFRGESFGRAFNAALLASGLQGRREGRMILVGPNALSKTFGPQLSKIYRLNQVGPNAAADYLANLGASVTKTNTITTSVTQGAALAETVAGGVAAQTTESTSITTVEAFGASTGPLIGLRATTDTRLGTITLVGDPAIVSVAEQYLRKLDLRQRQVALNVRILDVNLDNLSEFDNSFALRWGNNFIVNDRGQLLGAFGRDLPPDSTAFRRDVPREIEFQDGTFTVEGGAGGLGLTAESASRSLVISSGRERTLNRATIRRIERETGSTLVPFQPDTSRPPLFIVEPVDRNISNVQRNIERILGRNGSVQRIGSSARASGNIAGVARNPVNNYADTFFDFVRAQIVSGSTKLLASPTLILQDNPSLLREGSEAVVAGGQQAATQGISNIGLDGAIGRRRANEGVVRVGTNVVTGYETETPAQGGNVVCTPQLTTAGLVLGARVEKIDDNGFVTFTLSPSVSAITGQEAAPAGCGSPLNILSVRSLDTGALRVRDGQTLIMTGVISELDRQVVTKWPILGDIPLIGQFFRSTSGRKEKRELVILVSPRIVNDEQGGVFGYGYQPGTSAGRDFFGSAIFGDGGMN
jgi:Type II secretory pathway, component HofQ